MNGYNRLARVGAMIGATLVLGVTAASAQPAASVTTLTATKTGNGVQVAGKLAYAAGAIDAGTDPAGDSNVPGTDITAASVTPTSPTTLDFSLKIANMPPVLNGVPEAVHYNWAIAVTNGEAINEYVLQALRSSQWGAAGSAEPFFQLMTCAPGTTGGECSPTAELQGEMTATGLTFKVPTGAIGAKPGSVIGAGGDGVVSTLGAAGVVWFTNNGGDSIAVDDVTLPVPSVRVGIAPAGTPESDVALTAPAALSGASGFSTVLPAQPTGSYVVVAQVCYSEACGSKSVGYTAP